MKIALNIVFRYHTFAVDFPEAIRIKLFSIFHRTLVYGVILIMTYNSLSSVPGLMY